MIKTHLIIFKFLVLGILSIFILQEKKPIKYVQQSTIKNVFSEKQTVPEILTGVSNADSIYLHKNIGGIPLYFSKKVNTDVCNSKECRFLKITVYWNITGRYLGFELPNKGFLSKYDHDPFSEVEYSRLNELLANPDLPFNNISFEKLTQSSKTKGDLDATSGATTKSISEIVVKGAAYTTYTLWKIINGPTMDLASQMTEDRLTADLITLIIKSPNTTDKIWALDRLKQTINLTEELKNSMLSIIASDDFYLAYNTLEAIKSNHLNSDDLQVRLFSIYKNSNPSIKKAIIKKLMEAPFLSKNIIVKSRPSLKHLNGNQLETFLKLYTKFLVSDKETCITISEILDNKNKYISKKAYEFLVQSNTSYPQIMDRIKIYERNNIN